MQSRRRTIEAMTREALRAFRDAGASHMVVGAVAAGIWGTPRFTADTDFVAAVRVQDLDAFLAAFSRHGFHAASPVLWEDWKVRGSIRLPFRKDPVIFHVDVIAANSDYDLGALRRARPRRLFGMPVKVASREDAIVYKVLSWRPQDQVDVSKIVEKWGRRLDTRYMVRWVRWIGEQYPVFHNAERNLRAALRPLRRRARRP